MRDAESIARKRWRSYDVGKTARNLVSLADGSRADARHLAVLKSVGHSAEGRRFWGKVEDALRGEDI